MGSNGKHRKVLVIDDDVHIRRVIELKLKQRGYEVTMATNGEQGLTLVRSQKPDVVITDIMMPKLDGKSLCTQTNELKKEWPFLTIVITNRISPDDHRWVEEMHDTLFIEKPFSPSKLLECINRYFERNDDDGP